MIRGKCSFFSQHEILRGVLKICVLKVYVSAHNIGLMLQAEKDAVYNNSKVRNIVMEKEIPKSPLQR